MRRLGVKSILIGALIMAFVLSGCSSGGAQFKEGQTVTTTELVNVRSGPSLDSEVVTLLPPEDEITVVSQEGDWVKVSVDGGEYYILGEYLK